MPVHPRVKQYLNIKRNRASAPRRAVTLEGLWVLRAAVAAQIDIEVVFVCPELVRGDETHRVVATAEASGAHVVAVSQRVLGQMVNRDGPDGIAAVAHLRACSLEGMWAAEMTRLVVLDGLELAGNLGAIIRCADGAGANGVVLTSRRVRITHPLAVKSSMGTIFTMPIVEAAPEVVVTWARAHGMRLVAADPAATQPYRDVDYRGPIAIVLGSERYGLSPPWRDVADIIVSIPMLGTADSLNIGHAAALLLYEALHQQRT